jgi:uncharacterized membrane protein
MSTKKLITSSIVAGAVALAIAGANEANAMSKDKEKCYGVAKAGMNDCGDAKKTHSCMGHATVDGDPNEWVAVPAGLCEKLVGGSLTPAEGSHKGSCDSKSGCEGKSSCEGKSGCAGK